MYTVRMPKLDHMAEEGVLLAWHKREGDAVEKGDILFEFESEKATEEVISEESGVLLKIVAGEGETVPVSAPVAVIGEEDEEVPADPAALPSARDTSARAGARESRQASGAGTTAGKYTARAAAGKYTARAAAKISPPARKLARQLGIDLEELQQRFPGKVIKKEDIEAFIAEVSAGTGTGAAAGKDAIIELKGIRKTMFDRMSRVASTYAATTTVQRADVTKLIEMKEGLTGNWEEKAKPRYITFFLKAAAEAIKEFPVMNSTIDEEAGVIRLRKAINLGIAVDSERGLIVPVLHGVPNLGFEELSVRTNELVARAAANTLKGEDFRDGTFTITNAGPLGAYLNTPMINPPQSAILGTCSINDEPAVVDGSIEIRKLMFLTLTYDHRIIQGKEAVGFLKRVVELLEDPASLLE